MIVCVQVEAQLVRILDHVILDRHEGIMKAAREFRELYKSKNRLTVKVSKLRIGTGHRC